MGALSARGVHAWPLSLLPKNSGEESRFDRFGPSSAASPPRSIRIILFGSYAYGKPTYDSDVDLLVVMNTRLRELKQAVQISLAFDAPFPLDLMVRQPQTIRRRVALADFFLQEITSQGKVLYTAQQIRKLARAVLGTSPRRSRKKSSHSSRKSK